jgi:hypothetical protein
MGGPFRTRPAGGWGALEDQPILDARTNGGNEARSSFSRRTEEQKIKRTLELGEPEGPSPDATGRRRCYLVGFSLRVTVSTIKRGESRGNEAISSFFRIVEKLADFRPERVGPKRILEKRHGAVGIPRDLLLPGKERQEKHACRRQEPAHETARTGDSGLDQIGENQIDRPVERADRGESFERVLGFENGVTVGLQDGADHEADGLFALHDENGLSRSRRTPPARTVERGPE